MTRRDFWTVPGLLAVALAAQGCRKADFLYYQKNRAEPVVSFERVLKDFKTNDELDLLWVIDNSGSMAVHQYNVILNTQMFMDLFTKSTSLKWKMGMISTDLSSRPYLGFGTDKFDWQTIDPVMRFQGAVGALGIVGSGMEMTWDTITKALTNHPDFLRPGAVFGVIVVSDAPEQSTRSNGKTFLNFLKGRKNGLDLVRFYGILQPNDFGCPVTDDNFRYHGSEFEEVIKATNGQMHLLCDAAFSRHLVDIGENLITRMETSVLPFPDGVRPKPGSIRVLFHGNEVPAGPKGKGYWTYDFRANAIHFSDLSFAAGDQESVRVECHPE